MSAYLATHAAANEAAMLALEASRGDACVRADTSAVYQLTGADAAAAASWTRRIGLAAIVAAAAELRTAAAEMASVRVDGAMRYQGERYESDQEREFPRWANDRLVDADADGNAIVPANVLLAALLETDSILAADRVERQSARHDGVTSQGADGLQESYGGEERDLCRDAWRLMERYLLTTGSIR